MSGSLRSTCYGFALFCGCITSQVMIAQQDSSKPAVSINIHHLTINNSLQYLMVETKMKVNNKWQPLKGQFLQLYLDSVKPENLMVKASSDSGGRLKAIVPATLKPAWDATSAHKFIVVNSDGAETEKEISRAKILMDTSTVDSARMVSVQVLKWEGDNWKPAKGVDVKVGVRRLGGDLKIGDEESYSTDSLGAVAAQFKLDSLPGDQKGNLTLVAKVEDDDQYGSLSIEKTVPWGIRVYTESRFGMRALWASRGKAPVWLVSMAYSIIAAVWGVILYLVLGIVKIGKLGKQSTVNSPRSTVDSR